MRQSGRRTEEERNVYTDVYRLLVAGMIASVVFFSIGLILALRHPGQIPLTADWIRRHYHWSAIAHGLASGEPTTYLMIATVLLILTPVARVVVSIRAFFVDHDHKYVAVTSTVLAIMILTVVLGIFGLQ
jgi:uncharacterized membrane protein